jgi:hypothetical protein
MAKVLIGSGGQRPRRVAAPPRNARPSECVDSRAAACAAAGVLQVVLMIISISVSVPRANLAARSAVYMGAARAKGFGLRLICP